MKAAFRHTLLPTLCAALSLHCASTPELDDDSAAHTAEEPIKANAVLAWADVDYESFAATDPLLVGSRTVAATEPISRWLQAWIDHVHDTLSRELAARGTTLVAPKPTIVVLESTDVNAWVSSVSSCLPKPIVDESGALIAPVTTTGCVRPRNWSVVSDEDYARVLSSIVPECRVVVDGASFKALGGTCQEFAAYPGFATTAPFVFYSTALLGSQRDSKTIVQMLVHELGHYYRGHCANATVFEPYWYEQKEHPDPAKPAKVADSEGLESNAQQAGIATTFPTDAVRVPDQKLSPLLTLSIAGVIADMLPAAKAETPESFACEDALAMVDGRWRSAFYPGAVPSPEARASYLRFESALLACSDRLRVDTDFAPNALPGGQWSTAIFGYAGYPLRMSLETADTALRAREVALASIKQALGARHVGRYTTEQEADDFSLEYVAKLGFDPKENIDALFALVGQSYGKDAKAWKLSNDGIDFDTCRNLYEKDWRRTKDGTTEYVFIGPGDLLEPHHGDCYRLFNLSREQKAHAHHVAETRVTVEGDWETMRRDAEERTAHAPVVQHAAGEPAPNMRTRTRRILERF